MNISKLIRIIKRMNLEWLIIVETTMATHFHNLSPSQIGDAHKAPKASSIYFCFALALLMGEVEWWPRSFSKPPRAICNIYQAIVANVLTNISMNYVYVPMTDVIKWSAKFTTTNLQKLHKKPLDPIIQILKKQENVVIGTGLLCFGLVGMAIFISERVGCIKSFIKMVIRKL